MDIKSVLNAVIPLNSRGKERVDRAIKSNSTTDRDANGQMAGGGQQGDQHPPMSDDQLKKAIEHLKSLDIVREQNLTVELITADGGKKFVVIKEASGKTVRRIPEIELWSLQIAQKSEKGQLLRKTA
jgi:uncharacterized FlaG/YvyC family protein